MGRSMSYAAQAMHGEIVWGPASSAWTGASIDSRQVEAGDLFFALAGERADGHDYVEAALAAGAAGAVIERWEAPTDEPTGTGIHVGDSFAALHALTTTVRQEKPLHLVAVTGSAGKTTTKELLGRMLAKQFRTAVSPGNFNNLYGFPLSLLQIPDDTEWMVAEMGMSEAGELGRVSRMGKPEIAVFTNVGEAHLERLGSLEAVAAAKAELLEGLEPGGTMVANADDPWVSRIAEGHAESGGRVLTFGERGRDLRLEGVRSENARTLFELVTPTETIEIDLQLHGLHNAWNFAAAATVAVQLGVPAEAIAAVGCEVETPPMRGRVIELDDVVLIDDSYNSNPRALRSALGSAAELPCRRRVVVAGSMLELGDAGSELHRQLGHDAASFGFELVIGVGDEAQPLVEAAEQAGSRVGWYQDARAAAEAIPKAIQAGDVVLIKGSRGVGLEVVVAAIERRLSAAEEEDAV